MIIAATGHRPKDMGASYDMQDDVSEYIAERFSKIFDEYKPEFFISGLALGVDTISCLTALLKGIKVIAAIPFEGQESMWPAESQKLYNKILKHKLVRAYYVCEPGYEIWKMQVRNQFMVDNCDLLVGCWQGTKGGTSNCLDYARKVGKQTIIFHPDRYYKAPF